MRSFTACRPRDGCTAIGLDVYGGENAPYVWVACPDGLDSWNMFDRMLNDANVVITPGAGFGRHGEGFFRISLTTPDDRIAEAVERIRKYLSPA